MGKVSQTLYRCEWTLLLEKRSCGPLGRNWRTTGGHPWTRGI